MNKQLSALRDHFNTGETLSIESRIRALNQLENWIKKNERKISEALYQDLRKPVLEALTGEVVFVLEEIALIKKNLKSWAEPQSVSTPPPLWPAKSEIHTEPLGVVLIIGPWNFPFQCSIAPLVGAIAAGNCAVVKPSEVATATASLITQMIESVFSPDYVAVVNGGVAETTKLLEERFDHIFFTGSTAVGKVVAQAAARHLTPTTLELGGKNPAIICEDANLAVAARRICWGRFMNAGQACVAPDYCFIHESVFDRFYDLLISEIKKQLGPEPKKSADFARIINAKNYTRLKKLSGITPSAEDEKDLYFPPTILKNIEWDDPAMQEEIFGPIIVLFKYKKLPEVIEKIKKFEKPLAAYFFTEDTDQQDYLISSFSFGGGCTNDANLHVGNPNLPFGGVGHSGTGSYHGKQSFLTFSHQKSILRKSSSMDLKFRYPPVSPKTVSVVRKLFGLS